MTAQLTEQTGWGLRGLSASHRPSSQGRVLLGLGATPPWQRQGLRERLQSLTSSPRAPPNLSEQLNVSI